MTALSVYLSLTASVSNNNWGQSTTHHTSSVMTSHDDLRRQKIIREFISTERSYYQDLQLVKKVRPEYYI